MNNTSKEKFETLWNDFSTLIKGKLIISAQKQTLSTPLAKLILSDGIGLWEDKYSMYGRWLQQFEESEPTKAQLVKDVLLKDMSFTEVKHPSILPDYYNYIVPSIGACTGYAISKYLELGVLAKSALVIFPALLSYPIVKQYRKHQTEITANKTIESYMKQLEKYKNSVLSILS